MLAMARIAPRTGAHSTPTVEEPSTDRAMPTTAAITVAATESSAVETVCSTTMGRFARDSTVGAKFWNIHAKAAGMEPIA